VPLLPETAERVLFSAHQESALSRLSADRAHGAAELAQWVLDDLAGVCWGTCNPGAVWRHFQ
jgi:hypothetical protein